MPAKQAYTHEMASRILHPAPRHALRIAVIGGGVIGLSSALALARAGADVCVFEAGSRPGLRATGRAGGMLGLTYELEELQAAGAIALARRAMELWPSFAAALPVSADIRMAGAIACAPTPEESLRLEGLAAAARAEGLQVAALSKSDLAALEPGLTGPLVSAWRLLADGQVDPLCLVDGLEGALSAAGVRIARAFPVGEVLVTGEGFAIEGAGVWDRVLVATGAGRQPGFVAPDGLRLDPGLGVVIPVKGHMLALEAGNGAPRHVIRAGAVYIIPKARWTLIGATSEPGLADEATDPAALEDLRARAEALVPGLGRAEVIEGWAGVRPGSSTGAPVIGESAIPGVHAALGCYRNGILVAPAVAELVAAGMLGRDGNSAHGRFNPGRFDNRVAAPQSP